MGIRIKHFIVSILTLGVAVCWAVAGEIPLDSEETHDSVEDNLEWKVRAAQNALNYGLFHISRDLYKVVLEKGKLSPKQIQFLSLQYSKCLINLGDYEGASASLTNLPLKDSPRAKLQLAMISYYKRDLENSEGALGEIEPKTLPKNDRAWLFFLSGLIEQEKGEYEDAAEHFKNAEQLANVPSLRDKIGLSQTFTEILLDDPSEKLARKLKKTILTYTNGPAPVDIVLQYAVTLNALGYKAEAILALEKEIYKRRSYQNLSERQSMVFLMGIIAGAESEKGLASIKAIVSSRAPATYKVRSFRLLQEYYQRNLAVEEFIGYLEELINHANSRDILDLLLINYSLICIKTKDFASGSEASEKLLKEFPGSKYAQDALQVLAYQAWEEGNYRNSAYYLAKKRDRSKSLQEKQVLNVLIADSYFLNEDFDVAAEIYLTLLKEDNVGRSKGSVLFQAVLCLIRSGNIILARETLDEYILDLRVEPIQIWRSEWNLISAMKYEGQFDEAFLRVRRIISDLPDEAMTPELGIRLIWLKAQLSLESGNTAQTPRLADTIFELLDNYGRESFSEKEVRLIKSYTLLLKAQAFIAQGRAQEGLHILTEIRGAYPRTNPAILSYIMEARYYTSIGQTAIAQQKLIKLSDEYSESGLATTALYEAALNAESRQLNSTYEEALAILERLSSDYPNSPLVYEARLKQGDILRKLNKFSDALLVYQSLVNEQPAHKKTQRAQIGIADSLFALCENNLPRLKEAADSYERLFDLPGLSNGFRLEAGYKASLVYRKANKCKKAKEMLWLMISEYLEESDEEKDLSEKGRFWLARAILDLGNMLEGENQLEKAKKVYNLIITNNLPGQVLISSKIS